MFSLWEAIGFHAGNRWLLSKKPHFQAILSISQHLSHLLLTMMCGGSSGRKNEKIFSEDRKVAIFESRTAKYFKGSKGKLLRKTNTYRSDFS